jgi:hypothetical protein
MGQVLSAKLESLDVQLDKRIAGRRHLSLQVAGSGESEQNFNAIVRDLSQTGFLMESSVNLTRGEMIYVELPRRGRVSAEVAWTDGHRAGCRFVQSISSGSVSAALLGSLPDQRALVAAGPSLDFDEGYEGELSHRQKAFVILGLAMLAWSVLGSFAYLGLRLFHA